MRIPLKESIGIIIDMQSVLYPYIHDHEQLTRNSEILVKGLKILDVPLILTQQYTKGLGDTIDPIIEAADHQKHIEKTAFSCCDEPMFNEVLAVTAKKFVIITGIEAHVCVMQTVVDLLETGYIPVLVEDCVSSRQPNDKAVAVARMRQEGAVVTTYESILFELLQYSGTDTFKKISKLVK
jgi:nicotinamidase-related amidase